MENQWTKSGNKYFSSEVSQQMPLLPVAIFNIERDARSGDLYLEETASAFEFAHKLYAVETKLIARTLKTYENTSANLGVLLNGVKGTGKTVTSKQIANASGLPILLINADYPGMSTFINCIQQDVLIMIDEYEKIYRGEDSSVLTVMDGILSNGFRRIFLLTTNQLRINDNLVQRPGRLRYLKTFTDLTKEVIEEIVDDLLIHKHLRDVTVRFISRLQLITIDIVTAIVKEVNIHEESPEAFSDIFNVKKNEDLFNVFIIQDNEKIIDKKAITLNLSSFKEQNVGAELWADGYDYNLGEIVSVMDWRTVIVKQTKSKPYPLGKKVPVSLLSANKEGSTVAVAEDNTPYIPEGGVQNPDHDAYYDIKIVLTIEPVDNLHKSFTGLC